MGAPVCNSLEAETIRRRAGDVAREASQRCSDERRIELGVDELEMKSRKGSTRV
jgi:hypothetical protein